MPGYHMAGSVTARGVCTIDGCNHPRKGRGWCSTHYRRWQRTGTTDPGPCTVGGCAEIAAERGRCHLHLTRNANRDPRPPDALDVAPLVDYMTSLGGPSVVFTQGDQYVKRNKHSKTYDRARARGWIRPHYADRLAVEAFGVHPCVVYGDDWWLPEYFTHHQENAA